LRGKPVTDVKSEWGCGEGDRARVEVEARARIAWGDEPETVIKFMMMQGVSVREASSFVHEAFRLRVTAIRADGVKKLILGSVLLCVPVVPCLACAALGFLPLELFVLPAVAALCGIWISIRGLFMVLTPRAEP
jgi:hypothetical protein